MCCSVQPNGGGSLSFMAGRRARLAVAPASPSAKGCRDTVSSLSGGGGVVEAPSAVVLTREDSRHCLSQASDNGSSGPGSSSVAGSDYASILVVESVGSCRRNDVRNDSGRYGEWLRSLW
jgi:hypothetical protein